MIDRVRNGLALGMMMCAGMATTASAAGDLSDALDFVPSDVAVTITTANLMQTHGRMLAWAERLEIDDAIEGLTMAQLVLANEGLDAEGPAVLVFPEMDPDGPEPEPYILLAINDYEQFVFGLGGEVQEGVTEIEAPFGTVYAMPLGEEFVAVAHNEDLLDFVDPQGGNFQELQSMVGRTGLSVSQSSDVMIAANIEVLAPLIEDGMEEFGENMEMGMAMTGQDPEQAEALGEMLETGVDLFVRDGRAGLIGINMSEDGLALDFGANFAEGSEAAGYFQNTGNAGEHFKQLPSMPFLMAFSMDYSGEGIRSMLAGLAEFAGGMAGGGMMGGLDFTELLEANSGQAQVIGVTPGLFAGGLFANTVSFLASEEPAELVDIMRGLYADMDGEVIAGIEYETTYEQSALEVNGVEVDAWAIDMSVDPNDPNAMQAQMMLQQQMMLMGGGGPSGYIVRGDSGLYQTMSKNSELIAKALDAGDNGSMADDERIAAVAGRLPDNRVMEGFIDVAEVVGMVGSVAAMMGAEVPEIEAEMNPVAMGLVGNHGALRFTMFVPADVITTVKGMVEEMAPAAGGFDDDEGGAPRF